MDGVNERIKQVRASVGIPQREFASRVFISQSTFGEIETGVRRVNERIIQLISTRFNVSREWLKTGAGEMFQSERPDMQLERLIDIYRQLEKPLQDYLLEQSEALLKLHDENTIQKKPDDD
ncbi:MAG: helix-turn-helix transcriptional regulator [Treponema sp.]|nr:helix-turn-helix transcriptional regulator [Treponema sp.]